MRSQLEHPTPKQQMPADRGFSLIELLIVIAIILVIAGIAIPNFIQSKMRANEASAAQNSRTITTAEVIYSTTYEVGFSTNLTQLAGSGATVDQNDAQLIDEVLATGIKSGYVYTYAVVSQDSQGTVTAYSLNADPQTSSTGQLHFYTDQTAVIRSNNSVPAGPTDPPIQ